MNLPINRNNKTTLGPDAAVSLGSSIPATFFSVEEEWVCLHGHGALGSKVWAVGDPPCPPCPWALAFSPTCVQGKQRPDWLCLRSCCRLPLSAASPPFGWSRCQGHHAWSWGNQVDGAEYMCVQLLNHVRLFASSHGLQHAKPSCPSLSHGVGSNSCPLSRSWAEFRMC